MTVPSSFDYLRQAPTLEEVLSACRVPGRLRAAFRAVWLSCLFVLCAWTFEGSRLKQAIRTESLTNAHYTQQIVLLKTARIYEKRVRLLTDLDDQIRTIAESGTLAARRLAALSVDLPPDVWITALTPEADGVMLDGRAGNLTSLSDALVRLNADPLFEKPSLLSAQLTSSAAKPIRLRFVLRLGSKR
jgi:Tfp pilus assembly protein PilN